MSFWSFCFVLHNSNENQIKQTTKEQLLKGLNGNNLDILYRSVIHIGFDFLDFIHNTLARDNLSEDLKR